MTQIDLQGEYGVSGSRVCGPKFCPAMKTSWVPTLEWTFTLPGRCGSAPSNIVVAKVRSIDMAFKVRMLL